MRAAAGHSNQQLCSKHCRSERKYPGKTRNRSSRPLDDQPMSVVENMGFCHLHSALSRGMRLSPSHRHCLTKTAWHCEKAHQQSAWGHSPWYLDLQCQPNVWKRSSPRSVWGVSPKVSLSDALALDVIPAVTVLLTKTFDQRNRRGQRHQNNEGDFSCSCEETLPWHRKKKTWLHYKCTWAEVKWKSVCVWKACEKEYDGKKPLTLHQH